MKLYWKKESEKEKYLLMAEPAAMCFTLEFLNQRWVASCLGESILLPGALTHGEAKKKALMWFGGVIQKLFVAIEELQSK